MLSLSPRFDLFRFNLPKEFLPREVEDKWLPLFRANPGVVTTPIDYLNESIVGISLPGINDLNIDQDQTSTNSIVRANNTSSGSLGRINVEPVHPNTYKTPTNPLANIDREFKVNFRLNQGLYNYFMIYESIFYRMCKPSDYEGGEDFSIDILNEIGECVITIKLHQCHIGGIEGLDFSYDKYERETNNFEVTWTFNNIDIEIHDRGNK